MMQQIFISTDYRKVFLIKFCVSLVNILRFLNEINLCEMKKIIQMY